MIGPNTPDYDFYFALLRGDRERGERVTSGIFRSPVLSMELKGNLGGLSVLFDDSSPESFVGMLVDSGRVDEFLQSWGRLQFGVDGGFEELVGNSEAMDAVAASSSLSRAFMGSASASHAIVANEDVLKKLLASKASLPAMLESDVLSKAIADQTEALDLILSDPDLVGLVTGSGRFMAEIAKSPEALAKVMGSEVAWASVLASEAAIDAICSDETAFGTLLDDSDKWESVVDSEFAWSVVARHPIAWEAIVAKPVSLSAIMHNTVLWRATIRDAEAWNAIGASPDAISAIISDAEGFGEVVGDPTAFRSILASESSWNAVVNDGGAFGKVLSNDSAWGIVLRNERAISDVVASETAMGLLEKNQSAVNAMASSEVALIAMLSSDRGAKLLIGDGEKLTQLVGNSVVMKAVVSTETGMDALTKNEDAWTAVIKSQAVWGTVMTVEFMWQYLDTHPESMAKAFTDTTAWNNTCNNPKVMSTIIGLDGCMNAICSNETGVSYLFNNSDVRRALWESDSALAIMAGNTIVADRIGSSSTYYNELKNNEKAMGTVGSNAKSVLHIIYKIVSKTPVPDDFAGFMEDSSNRDTVLKNSTACEFLCESKFAMDELFANQKFIDWFMCTSSSSNGYTFLNEICESKNGSKCMFDSELLKSKMFPSDNYTSTSYAFMFERFNSYDASVTEVFNHEWLIKAYVLNSTIRNSYVSSSYYNRVVPRCCESDMWLEEFWKIKNPEQMSDWSWFFNSYTNSCWYKCRKFVDKILNDVEAFRYVFQNASYGYSMFTQADDEYCKYYFEQFLSKPELYEVVFNHSNARYVCGLTRQWFYDSFFACKGAMEAAASYQNYSCNYLSDSTTFMEALYKSRDGMNTLLAHPTFQYRFCSNSGCYETYTEKSDYERVRIMLIAAGYENASSRSIYFNELKDNLDLIRMICSSPAASFLLTYYKDTGNEKDVYVVAVRDEECARLFVKGATGRDGDTVGEIVESFSKDDLKKLFGSPYRCKMFVDFAATWKPYGNLDEQMVVETGIEMSGYQNGAEIKSFSELAKDSLALQYIFRRYQNDTESSSSYGGGITVLALHPKGFENLPQQELCYFVYMIGNATYNYSLSYTEDLMRYISYYYTQTFQSPGATRYVMQRDGMADAIIGYDSAFSALMSSKTGMAGLCMVPEAVGNMLTLSDAASKICSNASVALDAIFNTAGSFEKFLSLTQEQYKPYVDSSNFLSYMGQWYSPFAKLLESEEFMKAYMKSTYSECEKYLFYQSSTRYLFVESDSALNIVASDVAFTKKVLDTSYGVSPVFGSPKAISKFILAIAGQEFNEASDLSAVLSNDATLKAVLNNADARQVFMRSFAITDAYGEMDEGTVVKLVLDLASQEKPEIQTFSALFADSETFDAVMGNDVARFAMEWYEPAMEELFKKSESECVGFILKAASLSKPAVTTYEDLIADTASIGSIVKSTDGMRFLSKCDGAMRAFLADWPSMKAVAQNHENISHIFPWFVEVNSNADYLGIAYTTIKGNGTSLDSETYSSGSGPYSYSYWQTDHLADGWVVFGLGEYNGNGEFPWVRINGWDVSRPKVPRSFSYGYFNTVTLNALNVCAVGVAEAMTVGRRESYGYRYATYSLG